MKPAVARLLLLVVLFVGWLGYLFYLVQLGKPIILSRPQFLVSQLDVLATIEGDDQVKIRDVLDSPSSEAAAKLKAQGEIKVINLEGCKVAAPEGEMEADFNDKLKGQTYLLPLRPTPDGRYEVVPAPTVARVGPPRIYPDTPQVRAEYQKIRALKPG